MFIPTRRKWESPDGGCGDTKFTIALTAGYVPDTGASTSTQVYYPVLRKPADSAKPTFGIPKRQTWRTNDWGAGWGQYRYDIKNAYWYGTAHTFRDNEISAAAKMNDPSTNITTGLYQFAEYSGVVTGTELLTNTTFDTNTNNWTASNATLSSDAGGQSNNALTVTNSTEGQYGYARQSFGTIVDAEYKLTVYVKKGTAASCNVYVGTTAVNADMVSKAYTDATWTLKTIYFKAKGTTAYLRLQVPSTTAAQTALFDEVSLKYNGYDGSRTLYAATDNKVYSYNHTSEAWTKETTGHTADDMVLDMAEHGGVFYVTHTESNYRTLTATTWADGESVKSHFCYHDGTIYASDGVNTATRNRVYYGAAWAYYVDVGGSEDRINAMVSFGNDMVVIKSDGLYVIGTRPQDTTIANWQPKVMPVQTFTSERYVWTGKNWAVWNGRLFFNLGTSLAYYDGLDVVLVEYPWSVSPTTLGTITDINAMDDCLLVAIGPYVLSYHDTGAATQAKWSFVAYSGADTRRAVAVWFSRLVDPNRIWLGLDDVDTDATNTKYLKMYAGLFMPYTFAATSDLYTSWFDDSDQTVKKWLMEFYVEVDNCDATGNEVEVSYAKDGGTSFTQVYTTGTTDIVTDGIAKVPTSGYVGGSTLVSFQSLQIKVTIKSATGAVSPIVKAIEVVYQPRTPDRRQWDFTVLCKNEWEVGSKYAIYTSKGYRDFLWAASQQDTPITLTDEYGDTYTVSMVLVETVPYVEDGDVKGMQCRIHMEEV